MGTAELVGGMPYIDPEDYAESMRSDIPETPDIVKLIGDLEPIIADLDDVHPHALECARDYGLQRSYAIAAWHAKQYRESVEGMIETLKTQASQEGLL